MFAGLHKGKEALDQAKEDFGREARLLREVGAEYLVHLPDQYTDQHGGAPTESADIDPEQWEALVSGTDELARYLLEEYGVKLVFHPHADTHVDTQERIERFLSDTDPELVNLCLDTGHVSYCDGDNIEIIRRFPERITYVHLKSVDPVVRARVLAEKMSLAEAVKLGVMCEPPYGEPDMPPLLDELGELDREIYMVIEQDLYPVEPHIPLPIGARTAGYYVAAGSARPPLAVLIRRNRPGAPADDEPGRDDDLGSLRAAALETLEDEPHGHPSLLEVPLRHAGEVDPRVPSERAVVEPRQRHPFRHPDAGALQPVEDADGRTVVEGDQSGDAAGNTLRGGGPVVLGEATGHDDGVQPALPHGPEVGGATDLGDGPSARRRGRSGGARGRRGARPPARRRRRRPRGRRRRGAGRADGPRRRSARARRRPRAGPPGASGPAGAGPRSVSRPGSRSRGPRRARRPSS